METKSFTRARKAIPNCCGGYDPLGHRTVADLVSMVQFEIDLLEEGDDTDIKTKADERACRAFVAKFGKIAAEEWLEPGFSGERR